MLVYEVCGRSKQNDSGPVSLPYLTDGSVLQAYYGGVPTVIMGPGEPGMAHQTDEYCSINKIRQALSNYKAIIRNTRKNA